VVAKGNVKRKTIRRRNSERETGSREIEGRWTEPEKSWPKSETNVRSGIII